VPIDPWQVAKIAVGQKKLKGRQFTVWENILSEIITGDALGVDRIDYRLRDSHHAGVAYGKFDHHRLGCSFRQNVTPGGNGWASGSLRYGQSDRRYISFSNGGHGRLAAQIANPNSKNSSTRKMSRRRSG
jgi:hypothetical protein